MKKLGAALVVGMLTVATWSSVFGTVSSNAGKLIITEVAMKESNDWLELYVLDGSVDWYNYRIYRNASSYYALPDENYSTGQYIVLHEEAGTNGLVGDCWHFYSTLNTGLTGTDQNTFITDPGTASTYVDAVIYSDNNGSYTASANKANDLVADDMWNPDYDFSNGDAGAWTDSDGISSGQSLARYLDPGTPVYVDNNSKDDWYKSTNPTQGSQSDVTLPVTLTSFTALAGDREVTLHWVTESEVDNLGFYIYRSLFEERDYQQITSELIPGAGNSAYRNEYEYVDKGLTNGVTYWYKLEDVDYDGEKTQHGPISAIPTAKVRPTTFQLSQNYPNPFNPLTTIRYQIPEEGKVVLGIYNLLGQPIRRLVDTEQDAGDYQVEWDGKDTGGSRVGSGIYFYRLKTDGFVQVKKMVLVD